MPDDRKVLRFWEWTNFDDEQEDFYSNPLEEGRSLKGYFICLLYTSPSPRDLSTSRMPSSA